MKSSHVFVAALVIAAGVVSAGAAERSTPKAQPNTTSTQSRDAAYAACTQKVLKTLGTPPGTAAHFQDNWAAFVNMCAMRADGRW